MKPKPLQIAAVATILSALLLIGIYLRPHPDIDTKSAAATPASPIRYVAVGDSYTIGEGAKPELSWPALLTAHLNKKGIATQLVANPAATGWTTQQAIESELPIFENLKPTFGSLLIGVNDWVQGVDESTFRANLILLMDRMLAALPDKRRLLIVTIPDFSVTPNGAKLNQGRNASAGIAAFNSIITEEAHRRGLKVVDIYSVSKKMGRDNSLVAPDKLHPSAKEYAIWEKLIFPTAFQLLKPDARRK